MNPGIDTPLTDRELRYLAKLAHWLLLTSPDGWHFGAECGAESHIRAEVRHAPGCVFFGLPQGTLAALEAWEAA